MRWQVEAMVGAGYNYFRDCDPRTGRYIQSDPIGLYGGSLSTYTYAEGDPLGFDDAFGLYITNIPHTPESYKGAAAYVCKFYNSNSSAGPWGTAEHARDVDPGNLDKRNAEHYLYAQQLRSDWGGRFFWGGVVAVLGVLGHQVGKVARVGPNIPFPTSPPSWQDFAWGITGALNPAPPNCGCDK